MATFLFRFAMKVGGGGNDRAEARLKSVLGFANGLGQLIVPVNDTYLHELAYEIVEAAYLVEGR